MKQRLVVKILKQSYTIQRKCILLVFNKFLYIGKCFSYFHGDSERHKLAIERNIV
jgi:hypothetical protein